MSVLSTIETRIPPEARKEINRLLIEGMTYDAIAEWASSRGYDISRSAIGRYGQGFRDVYRQVLQFGEQAEALVSDAGGDGLQMDEAVSRLIMQQIMTSLLAGDDIVEKPKLVQAFASLQKANLAREKLKTEFRDRVKDAAEKAENIARKGGLSEETVQKIRSEILGVTG